MTPDDRTLLRKTHAGHEPSARDLWRRHAGWMLAYARTLLGARPGVGADDVVQAVFCRLLALDRTTIRGVGEVRPWLAQFVRHEAFNQIRTARRAAERESRTQSPSQARAPAPEAPDLAAAMASLPRRLREVAHLRHVSGLTTDQTALALGVPRGTVASRCHAAVRALRDMLDTVPNPATTPAGEPCHVLAD